MKLFLIAGEPSGDRLGAALMAGLKSLVPDVTFCGIGGPQMMAEGMESLFDMSELSVMGIAEIAPKYFHLKRRIRESADAVLEESPDALITIDSPDFCLRVAKLVKARSDIRTIHYVAPTVWAWRPGRAQKMARMIDHVLALFPFEPPYMQAAGMRCDFVGHPVVAEPAATTADIDAFNQRHGLGDAPSLLLLPGSRMNEVTRMMPVFREVADHLKAKRPDLRFILPVAPGPVEAFVTDAVAEWAHPPLLLLPGQASADEKRAAFARADVALAASGTVSLELAAADTPMVIAYDMNWLSFRIIRAMARIDTVTLVNLVSETRVVPEFLGPDCRAEKIVPAVDAVFANPNTQRRALATTMERLGQGGEAPGLRAAKAVLDGLES